MTNSICRNHQKYKQYLSAYRLAYARAKGVRKLEIMLSFAPVIACLSLYQLGPYISGGARDFPADLLNLCALTGVLMLLVCDLKLEPLRAMHRRAANVDLEAYDTAVLEFPWHAAVTGEMPSQSALDAEARGYDNALASAHPPELSLEDSWYPPLIETIAIEPARLYCLRQNCSFEIMYRQKYMQLFLLPMLIITSLLIAVQIFLFGGSLPNTCCTLITASPIFRMLLLGLTVQNRNCRLLQELKANIDEALKKQDTSAETARAFQDRLFLTRDTQPLISIAGFKHIKLKYLPVLKAETEALLRSAGH